MERWAFTSASSLSTVVCCLKKNTPSSQATRKQHGGSSHSWPRLRTAETSASCCTIHSTTRNVTIDGTRIAVKTELNESPTKVGSYQQYSFWLERLCLRLTERGARAEARDDIVLVLNPYVHWSYTIMRGGDDDKIDDAVKSS
jgi:hypothetical protein